MRYDAESMNTILVVLAHPDDETFIFGGTIAKYSKLGFPVDLLILTSEHSNKKNTELRDATKILGVRDLHRLNYFPTPIDTDSDVHSDRTLSKVGVESVAAEIENIIEIIKPGIVLSFDPTGVYGHPDHIISNQSTRIALQRYIRIDSLVSLYEISFARNLISIVAYAELFLQNLFPRIYLGSKYSFLTNKLKLLPPITTKIDISSSLKVRHGAVKAHFSSLEAGPWYLRMFEKIPHYLRQFIANKENFVRVYPEQTDFDDSSKFVGLYRN
tara:strand:- start:834 stop:1646 length:813 start_codon:yes stop_codon:yes gene_type:complete